MNIFYSFTNKKLPNVSIFKDITIIMMLKDKIINCDWKCIISSLIIWIIFIWILIFFNLEKRRHVGCLTLLYKMLHNPSHPLYCKLPGPFIQRRITRYSLSLNDRAFSSVRCRTNQFLTCFIPYTICTCRIWSELPSSVVNSPNLQSFKVAVNAFFFILYLLFVIVDRSFKLF